MRSDAIRTPRVRLRWAVTVVTSLLVLAIGATSAGARGVRQPPPSLFGVNTGTYDDDYGRFLRDVPMAKSLGAKWVEFSGANIKFIRGRPDFGQMDRQVNRARSQGLGVMIALGGIPRACSVHPRPQDVPLSTHVARHRKLVDIDVGQVTAARLAGRAHGLRRGVHGAWLTGVRGCG